MEKVKTLVLVCGAVVIGLLLLNFCGCTDKQAQGTVVAQVGDQVLTLEEIAVMTSPGEDVIVPFEVRREFVQQWIDTEVLYREALREKLHNDPKIERAIRQMEKELLAAELMEKRIGREMAIADREIEEYYKSHSDEYILTKPLRRARHILLDSREQALRVRNRLQQDEPFDSLVVEMSIDSATHGTGGDLGLFSREEIAPELAEAAFALNIEDISEPIQTEWGYHILQITEAIPEGGMMPLDEVKETIANTIFAAKQRLAFDSLMKDLKAHEDIEVQWELLQKEP